MSTLSRSTYSRLTNNTRVCMCVHMLKFRQVLKSSPHFYWGIRCHSQELSMIFTCAHLTRTRITQGQNWLSKIFKGTKISKNQGTNAARCDSKDLDMESRHCHEANILICITFPWRKGYNIPGDMLHKTFKREKRKHQLGSSRAPTTVKTGV